MIDIIQTEPMRPVVEQQLNQRYTVHRLWQADDRDACLEGLSGKVVGLVSGGHSPVDAALMDQLPGLRIIAGFGVGYDHIDARAAAARGIVVTNTPDVLSDEVADLAVGLLIATIRRLPQAEQHLRSGNWQKGSFPLTSSLRGRKAGIAGLGRIGKAIARRLAAFDIEIAYHGRNDHPDAGLPYYASLADMARDVTILISTLPGGPDTRGAIDGAVLKALGPEGVLINVGRGSVVDEAALGQALHAGTIAAAGLDVFAEEPDVPPALLTAPNAVLLPHVGSGSLHTRDAMGQLVVDNLHSWFASGKPLTPVSECLSLVRS